MTEEDKFTYSSLGKAFEKQTKTIKEQGKITNKDTWKESRTKLFRHRSKITWFFVSKIFSKWKINLTEMI